MEKTIQSNGKPQARKRYFLMAVVIILGSILIYYTVVTVHARLNTKKIVTSILDSGAIRLRLSDLTPRQLSILLLVEDPEFFHHKGVDLKTPGAGLTTITQALVKLLYFENFKPGIRKLKQTLIARFALDPIVSKEDQLLLFINIFGFCYDTKGFSEASQFYYGKTFTHLNEEEYISIVAMMIGCSTYNIKHNPEANRDRSERIRRLINGEYVPKKMSDIYYEDTNSAFRMK